MQPEKLENTCIIAERRQNELRESGERFEKSYASIKRHSNNKRACLECIGILAQLMATLQGETPPPAR